MSSAVSSKAAADAPQWRQWLTKLQDENAQWGKVECIDILYWVKQLTALVTGVTWGLIPVTGVVGLFLFLVVFFCASVMWYRSVLKVDEEEFGGHWELLQEGFGVSLATFLLSWITVYSSVRAF